MLEVLACGYNIFCHFKNVNNFINPTRYPPEVAELCTFLSTDGKELPDYCQSTNRVQIPRRRSEF